MLGKVKPKTASGPQAPAGIAKCQIGASSHTSTHASPTLARLADRALSIYSRQGFKKVPGKPRSIKSPRLGNLPSKPRRTAVTVASSREGGDRHASGTCWPGNPFRRIAGNADRSAVPSRAESRPHCRTFEAGEKIGIEGAVRAGGGQLEACLPRPLSERDLVAIAGACPLQAGVGDQAEQRPRTSLVQGRSGTERIEAHAHRVHAGRPRPFDDINARTHALGQ